MQVLCVLLPCRISHNRAVCAVRSGDRLQLGVQGVDKLDGRTHGCGTRRVQYLTCSNQTTVQLPSVHLCGMSTATGKSACLGLIARVDLFHRSNRFSSSACIMP